MRFKDSTPLTANESNVVEGFLAGLGSQWLAVSEDSAASEVLASFTSQVDRLKEQRVAEVPEVLCSDRFPGEGRSTLCDKEATQRHGGPACQLVAHAFLASSKGADFA